MKVKNPSYLEMAKTMPQELLEEAHHLLACPISIVKERASDQSLPIGSRMVSALLIEIARKGDINTLDALLDRMLGPWVAHA